MLFWLKKILSVPLQPLNFALLVATAGLVLLWTKRRPLLARVLLTVAVVTLALASNKGVALLLLRPLESRYAPLPEFANALLLPPDLAACRHVVVLGGGHGDGTTLSRVNQLSTSSLSRLTEAIRLLRLLPPDARLIVSGNNGPIHPSHARILAEAAVSLGVDPARIVRMDETRDTEDEALGIQQRIGHAPFVLVTSAWHMPRAMALCRGRGLTPVAGPADFLIKPDADEGWGLLAWDLGSLERTTKAIREYAGMLWVSARGRT